jgi:tetratricopeptide (TPR) repeat protein
MNRRTYTIILWILCLNFTQSLAQDIDKLKLAYAQESNRSKKVVLLDSITSYFSEYGISDSSVLKYNREFILLSRQLGDSVRITNGWYNIGWYYYLSNQTILSNQACRMALNSISKTKDGFLVKSDIYSLLGLNYSVLKNDVKELEHYHLALQMINKTNNLRRKADILANITKTYKMAEKADSIKYYARLTLDTYKSSSKKNVNNLYDIGGIGIALLNLDSIPQAIYIFKKGLEQAIAQNIQPSIKTFYRYLGTAYYKKKDYSNAKKYFLLSEQTYPIIEIVTTKLMLSKIFEAENDYYNAYGYYKAAKDLEEDTGGKKIAQQFYEAELLYQEALQSQEILRVQNKTLKVQQFTYWVLSLLTISIIVSALIGRLYIQKKRSEKQLAILNKEIASQNEEITMQTENLIETNNKLTYINENLDLLVKQRTEIIESQKNQIAHYAFMNAHEIRGPLATLLGLINIIEDENLLQQNKEIEQYLRKAAEKMDKVIHYTQDRLNSGEW